MSERLREALIAHEKKVVDMVLSCQGDPKSVQLSSTEVLESRDALLAALAADVPEGPTLEQIAAILCRGHSHTLRGLRGPTKTAKDLPCDRCLVWARAVRDALNALHAKGDG